MEVINCVVKDCSFKKTLEQEYKGMPVRLMNVLCLEYTECVQAYIPTMDAMERMWLISFEALRVNSEMKYLFPHNQFT